MCVCMNFKIFFFDELLISNFLNFPFGCFNYVVGLIMVFSRIILSDVAFSINMFINFDFSDDKKKTNLDFIVL